MQARVAAIELKELPQRHRLVGWLDVLRIYVALAIFQPYRDLEAGDKPISKIVAARIEPRTSFSVGEKRKHYSIAVPNTTTSLIYSKHYYNNA